MTTFSSAEQNFRDEELLADVICRLIGDARHIAVGAASPIPATAPRRSAPGRAAPPRRLSDGQVV